MKKEKLQKVLNMFTIMNQTDIQLQIEEMYGKSFKDFTEADLDHLLKNKTFTYTSDGFIIEDTPHRTENQTLLLGTGRGKTERLHTKAGERV
ncbi:hypothetical protein LHV56_19120 [Peribacillus frigoritolerans]|uniref:hypothetical protein n=1 Tax=Peribacillus frigoritolerans TaxID=450367 RepID=UPI00207AEC20|nr:hypothetical protein [Peribacillus frigoritolerans]USK78945.1 hypothetical protein LHV56_19120 [Peribacillus frigoritolerans]